MQPEKVQAIQEWKTPSNLTDVRSFLGFANIYWRFIHGFSSTVIPLTELTRKDQRFLWDKDQQLAFKELKRRFTSVPILAHFYFDRDVIVETDTSDYISAGVLSQYGSDSILHPVAFFSNKHSPAECNYEIYDKKLMAIVRAFEQWRAELQSVENPIHILTDHKNLEYFMTSKLLNRRQARWVEFLSQFNFKITYRPGKQGGKPDALIRRSGDLPEDGDENFRNETAVLKPHNQDPAVTPTEQQKPQLESHKLNLLVDILPGDGRDTLRILFKRAYQTDKTLTSILQALERGDKRHAVITLADCENRGGILFYCNRFFVPQHDDLRLHLMQIHHDSPAYGHPGQAKALELLQRTYYWDTMRRDVDRFVRNCEPCRRSRTSWHAPY